LIKEALKAYNESKLAVIQRFAEDEFGVIDEPGFLDVGYINTRIETIKKEYSKLEKELDLFARHDRNDSYHREQLNTLLNARTEKLLELAFVSSNDFGYVDSCIKLLEGINTDFSLCLQGLKYYSLKEVGKAFECFYEYFKNKSGHVEHYLINKTYGELLLEYKQYELAAGLLRKACEKRPEDLEIHYMLKRIYSFLGKRKEENVEKEIIKLLEG
jgi:tetratricopeptide (TPR) repeat protein